MAPFMLGNREIMTIIGAYIGISIIIIIALYVYYSYALMVIAKKLKKRNYFLVWIPIVNLFYIPIMAGYDWYYGFLWFLSIIPGIGMVVLLILTIWFFWKISEGVNQPGWLGILMVIPVINLGAIGILAWM